MRRITLLPAFLLALLLGGCAVPTALSPQEEGVAITRRMNDLSRAIVAADKAALESIAWPELSYGHSGGRIENHAQYVDVLVSKKSIITKVDLSKTTTTMVGDLALVRGHMFLMVESTGKPVPTDLEFLMVWQKRGGEWRLLARQAYKI